VNSGIYNLTVYISLPRHDPLLLAGTNGFVVTVSSPYEEKEIVPVYIENKVISLTSN